MKKNITLNDMKKITTNLMMNMSQEEIEIIREQVQNSVDQLSYLGIFNSNQYNLDKVKPFDYPEINVSNDFREDVVKEFKNKESLLKHPKEISKGLIKV